jgi:hypothetical protein
MDRQRLGNLETGTHSTGQLKVVVALPTPKKIAMLEKILLLQCWTDFKFYPGLKAWAR